MDNQNIENNADKSEQKTINIVGTNNRYMMTKINREKTLEPKKREVSKNWTFSEDYFNYNEQIKIIFIWLV